MEALKIRLAKKSSPRRYGDFGTVYKGGENILAAFAIPLGQGQYCPKNNDGGVLGTFTMVVVQIERMAHCAVGPEQPSARKS
jgi:hypothetical protein